MFDIFLSKGLDADIVISSFDHHRNPCNVEEVEESTKEIAQVVPVVEDEERESEPSSNIQKGEKTATRGDLDTQITRTFDKEGMRCEARLHVLTNNQPRAKYKFSRIEVEITGIFY